jgi:hypothetical protein
MLVRALVLFYLLPGRIRADWIVAVQIITLSRCSPRD